MGGIAAIRPQYVIKSSLILNFALNSDRKIKEVFMFVQITCLNNIGSVPVFVEHMFFLDQNLTVVPQDFGIIIKVITLRQVLDLLPHEEEFVI